MIRALQAGVPVFVRPDLSMTAHKLLAGVASASNRHCPASSESTLASDPGGVEPQDRSSSEGLYNSLVRVGIGPRIAGAEHPDRPTGRQSAGLIDPFDFPGADLPV